MKHPTIQPRLIRSQYVLRYGLTLIFFLFGLLPTLWGQISTLTAINDQAFIGPLQKVKVNVLVNDVVPCSDYILTVTSALHPENQGTAQVLPDGYIEFMPGSACRNTVVNIGYKVSCGALEATATLSINVAEYNYPDNVIFGDMNCYNVMPSNVPFGIKKKYSTDNGNPAGNFCIDGFTSPMVGDLNGDGKPEIVMIGVTGFSDGAAARYGRYINIYNGQTGVRMYQYDFEVNFGMGDPYHRPPSILALADLDKDGMGEIVVAQTNGRVCALKPSFNGADITGISMLWEGRANGVAVNYAAPLTASQSLFGYPQPYIADLNGDNIPEVIVYNKIFNGATGALLMSWQGTASTPRSSSITSGLADNSYANPTTETSANNIRSVAMTGRRPGNGGYSDNFVPVIAVYDIDGDGQQEIIAGNRIHKIQINSLTDHSQNTYTTIEGPASVTVKENPNNSTTTLYLSDGFTRVADIDGDGYEDIIVASFGDNGSLDLKVLVYVWDPRDPSTAKAAVTYYSDGEHGNFSIPFIGDINDKQDGWDGSAYTRRLPEICILSGGVYINRATSNDGRTGIKFHPLSDEKLRQGTAASTGTDAGWDNNQASNSNRRFNRTPEGGHIIGLTYDAQAQDVEDKLKLSWGMEHSDRSQNTGITLFDFNNDDAKDLCYRDETTLRVISPKKGNNDYVTLSETTSTTGTSIMFSTPVFCGTAFEYPTIADVNLDGSADILVTQTSNSRTLAGSAGWINVYEYSGHKWAPCPPVWNQGMYDPLQVGEDLKINSRPQSMLTEYTKNGKKIYPYNGSWIQQPIVRSGQDYVPVTRYPDAMFRNMEVNVLNATSTTVTLTIYNKGMATIAASCPISFYNGGTTGNPFEGSSYVTTDQVGIDIFPNETAVLTYTLSGNYNNCLIWARIMDNNTAFPVIGYEDCDLSNNTMSGIDCPYLQIKTTVYPSNVICGANGVTRLSVTNMAGGAAVYNGTPAFQWYKNDIIIPDAVHDFYIASEAGRYSCLVEDGICRKKTDDEIITVNSGSNIDKLVLNALPATGYLCDPPGQVSITVGNPDSYSTPVEYIWYKDNVLQSAQTTNTYVADTEGVYRLALVSGGCMVTETFKVTQTTNKIPAIQNVTQPAAVCTGNPLILSVPAVTDNGCPVVSEGWQISTTVGGSSFVNFDPSTEVTLIDNGKYIRYYALNDCGTSYSNEVLIAVMTVPTIANITAPAAICEKSNLSMTNPSVLNNGGSPVISASWQKETASGSAVYEDISMPYTVSKDDNGTKIRYRVTNVCGDSYSNEVVITVNPLPVPVLNGLSSAAKGQSGIVYTTDAGMTDYVWGITGGTITSGGNNFDQATVTWGNGSTGIITVTYKSNACQSEQPSGKTVALSSQSLPVLTGATTVCPVTRCTYTTDPGKYDYEWTIAGGTPQTSTIGSNTVDVLWDGSVAPSVKVSYRHQDNPGLPLVEITESNITKQQVTTITKVPVGNTVCHNNSHTMDVEADCEGTPDYQWKKDGTTNVGTNSASYTATETGNYTVTVSGVCGTATTDPVTVTVKSQPVATLNGAATAVTTQQVTYTAGTGSNYNWNIGDATRVSGGDVSDNTVTVYWTEAGTKTVTVNYTVDGCPTNTSTTNIIVSSQGTPVINDMDYSKTNVCFNTSQTYSTKTNMFNYTWTVAGGTISSGQNTNEITVLWGSAGAGTIKVAYSEDVLASPVESAETNITIHNKPSVGIITAPAGVCNNTNLNLVTPSVSSSLGVTQNWYLNDVIFTSGNSVDYSQNGQQLYYEATNACGTAESNTTTIKVYPTPVAGTFSDISVCSGASHSIIIPDGGVNLSYYTWSGGSAVGIPDYSGTNMITIPGFVAPNVLSVNTVTIDVIPYYYGAVGTHCPGTATSFTVTVNPLPVPTISGTVTAAKGQEGVVYTTEPGKNNYDWEVVGGTITSGGDNFDAVTVTWGDVSPGTVTVTYKSNGCAAETPCSHMVSLANQAVPHISGTEVVCPENGNSYTYITENNKYDYVWTVTGGTVTSGQNSNEVTVTWDEFSVADVKVTYRHENNPGLPLVEETKNITKQAITKITTAPVGNTVCHNNTHTMTVVATGEGTLNYQWKKGTVDVGTNNDSYTATETGSYTVTVTGSCSSATSADAIVTVKIEPQASLSGIATAITTQQVTYTAGMGSNYNWSIGDATLISGGTSSDNTVTVYWTAAGSKGVSVNYMVDGCPTTTATQTTVISAQGTPVIDDMDYSKTNVCFNTTQTYSTKSGMFNYVWTVTGGTVSLGQNTNEITVLWGSAGTGSIKVAYGEEASASPVESAEIEIIIHDKPSIGTVSAPAGVCDNTSLDLTAPAVTSILPVSTQGWKLNNQDFISGDIVTYAQNGQQLYYEAVNACGTGTTNAVGITVYQLPTVIANVTPQSICPGESIDLSTTVINSAGNTLSFYTTETGGTALTGSIVSPTATTTYYVEAQNSNNCMSLTRTPVTVTLKTGTAITAQPAAPSSPVGVNNSFSLSVTAEGNDLTYQWYKKGYGETTFSALAGATSASYTVNPTAASDYGQYYVEVNGDCGTAQTSNIVTVYILSQDATLKDLAFDGTTVPGFDPAITTYQCYLDCDRDKVVLTAVPNDANAVLNPTSPRTVGLSPGDNLFTFTVTAEDGLTTKTYTINLIRDCYVPRIIKDLEDASVCIGGSHTWSIEVEGKDLTYEWYCGNNRIMGVNSNTITIRDVKLIDYERYYVIVRSNYNGFISSAYSKRVKLWVADYLPAHLKFAEYPNPATVGNTYHIKVDGYQDVTKYAWSYSQEGVDFSPETGKETENETWATFGNLAAGTGTLKVTMDHPCGTREVAQTITVQYPTGVEDITATVVSIYPNPTLGILKVLNTTSNQEIRVMDVTGSLKGTFKTQEGVTIIDLTGYAKGTYIVQYDGKTYKVIKK